ncbi:hypothetical protein NC315_13530 [Streptomyces sp. G2]|uniref:hypothetical protein n=1 Tax=Streptomyces sp. G2 TaxID=1684471 RepID=UPI00202DB8FF|nr:hypothetical protein [Streptomyces sp. G2]MCM1946391.1 hypothetical protein [Streptomyces sp. G2]
MPYVSLGEFVAALTGDSVEAAVSEGRCLVAPMGCGEPVMDEDGNLEYDSDDPADGVWYSVDWQMTGLCPSCQDELDDPDPEVIPISEPAIQDAVSLLDLWSELERDDDE